MLRVLMITYSVYEFDNRVERYCKSLNGLGHRVEVICLSKNCPIRKEEYYDGIKLYRMGCRRFDETSPISYLVRLLRFLIRAFFLVSRLHIKKRYDVIHYHNIPDFGIFCTIVPKIFGARIILDIHDLVPEFYARKFSIEEDHPIVRLLKWIEKISCSYADHVLTATDIWKEIVVERSVEQKKCSVILNTPYPPLFDSVKNGAVKKQKSRFTMLYHGALNEHFGVDIAVRAVAIIKERVPEILFKIYGTGREEDNLKKLVKELGISKNVYFHKPVPREKIPALINDADIGVVPKRSERFSDKALSSKLLEFVYMNKPVVVSRTTASERYFDETMVLYFEPENQFDLARGVIYLYENPEKRRELSRNTEKFNRKHQWKDYEAVYIDILNSLKNRDH